MVKVTATERKTAPRAVRGNELFNGSRVSVLQDETVLEIGGTTTEQHI